MKARKLSVFEDRNLDKQVQEICDSQILRDLGGSNRKWIISGVTVGTGTDELGNTIEITQLALLEIMP